jgi:hypothetical protein
MDAEDGTWTVVHDDARAKGSTIYLLDDVWIRKDYGIGEVEVEVEE